ncbi:MAG: hypothetical protein ABI281_08060 [Caldimonas sp.]
MRKVVGTQHFLALMADGSVVGWGRHREGQLGEPSPADARRRYAVAAPVRIALPAPAIDIAAGVYSSFALLNDGSVWAWGRGSDGELGLGREAIAALMSNGQVGVAVPRRIDALQDIVQITMAGNIGHALRRDGALFSWGTRSGGLLGDGRVSARWGESLPVADTPVAATLLGGTRVAKIGTGSAGVAIDTEGRVLQWPIPRGPDKAGDVWKPLDPGPAVVPLPGPAVDLASTGGARLALLRDGTVWAWGDNMQGLFGVGRRADTNDPDRWRAAPQPVPGVRDAVALVAGTLGRHALVLLRDGSLRGWGNSDWGQIGAGVEGVDQSKAVTPKISGVVRVWAGGNNSFALTRDGRFWSWGASQDGTGLLGAQSKLPVAWPPALLQPT